MSNIIIDRDLPITVTGIEWDTEDVEDTSYLPTKPVLTIEKEFFESEDIDDLEDLQVIISDYISDKLSDEFGFCHNGFNMDIDDEELLEKLIS